MNHPSLLDLEFHQEFIRRHIGPTTAQQAEMAKTLGYDSLEALIDATVPEQIRRRQPMDLGGARTEQAVIARLRSMANKNRVLKSYIGTGYHD
ncbi:MAG TPA: hypothetical protein VIC02_02095, partial [Kineobactrum sp.]